MPEQHDKRNQLVFAFFLFLIFLPLAANMANLYSTLINANDFSIYQQALYQLADNILSFNPYVSVRNLKILNDHFDPILIPVGKILIPVFGIFSYHPLILIILDWAPFFAACLFIFNRVRKDSNSTCALVALSFIIFARPVLMGLEFPIHPSTWSLLPITMFFYYLGRQQILSALFWGLLLLSCRETFACGFLGLALFYTLCRRWTLSLIFVLLGGGWLALVFPLRKIFLGPVVAYGGGALQTIKDGQWLDIIWGIISFIPAWNEFLSPILVILLAMSFYFPKGKTEWRELWKGEHKLMPFLAATFFSLPIYATHAMASYLVHHHALTMAMPLLVVAAFSELPQKLLKQRKILIVLLALFIGTCSSRYTRSVKAIGNFLLTYDGGNKIRELREVRDLAFSLPPEANIFATGSLVPWVMKPGQNLFQMSVNTPVEISFSHLFVSKDLQSDPFPLNHKQVQEVVERCLSRAHQVLLEGKFFAVYRGDFNRDCLELHRYFNYQNTLLPKS